MCFDPKRDGAQIWPTIHIFAANADTPEQQQAYVNFIKSLTIMYPCERCRNHTSKFLESYPVEDYTGSAQKLLYWSWIYHDSVNQKLGKPVDQRWTWEQTRAKYMAPCDDERPLVSSQNGNHAGECRECSTDPTKPTPSPIQTKPQPKRINPKSRYIHANDD